MLRFSTRNDGYSMLYTMRWNGYIITKNVNWKEITMAYFKILSRDYTPDIEGNYEKAMSSHQVI